MINSSSRPITTLFGIPLHLHWSALLTALLVAVSASTAVGISDAGFGATVLIGGLAAALFGGSLLAHEYAHALMARHHGIAVRRVSLWGLGGVAELESEPRRWTHELSIAVVGPMTSLAVGLAAAAAALGFDLGNSAVPARLFAWLAIVNVALGLFNMLPGLPLDGGRVLHAVIWWRTSDPNRATILAAGGGRMLGGLLIGYGIWSVVGGGSGLFTAVIGYFILTSASQAQLQALRAIHSSRPDVIEVAATESPEDRQPVG